MSYHSNVKEQIVWYIPLNLKSVFEDQFGTDGRVRYLNDLERQMLINGVSLQKVLAMAEAPAAQPAPDAVPCRRRAEAQAAKNANILQIAAEIDQLTQKQDSLKGLLASFKRLELRKRIDELNEQLANM